MASNTLEKLSYEELSSVCGGQVYCAWDHETNATKYFVPDKIGIFMCYNKTTATSNAIDKNSPIVYCKTIQEAEHCAWCVVDSFYLKK